MTKIAMCGMGSMGKPMAIRLVEAGHDVTVWNRTAGRADEVADRGARVADTPAEAAAGAEIAVTMLSAPDALEEVLFGPSGLAEGLSRGSCLVEMSTVGPKAVRAAAERLPDGVEMIDAPVLGSIPQATSGELQVFVGGTEDAYTRLVPVLRAFGTPRHVGPLGAGASMKLVVNSTLGSVMSALGEALSLADGLGLDEDVVLDVLEDAPVAITVRAKRSMIESGSYPANFKLSLGAKDIRLVTETAEGAGRPLRLAPAALAWMQDGTDAGLGDLDYSAVIAHIRGRPAGP